MIFTKPIRAILYTKGVFVYKNIKKHDSKHYKKSKYRLFFIDSNQDIDFFIKKEELSGMAGRPKQKNRIVNVLRKPPSPDIFSLLCFRMLSFYHNKKDFAKRNAHVGIFLKNE